MTVSDAAPADNSPTRPVLSVSDLGVTYIDSSGTLTALQGVGFEVCAQEFVCILGSSGSGKSTLLRVIAGLISPTRGSIRFAHPENPHISLVFQDANLMPWRTVIENITLPLLLQNIPPKQAQERAREMIERVGLRGFEETWPRDLSGGMRSRVSIARALIQEPDLLLLDEPFGALDALTRERMGDELLSLWQAQRQTVLMVTHSIGEALLLSDRVLVLTARPGNIGLDLAIPLPRPRSEAMRYSSVFGDLTHQIKDAIH